MEDEDIEDLGLEKQQKIDLINLLRTFKKEGLGNFIVVRKEKFENLLSRLKTAENKLNRYERECKMFRSFCRKVRKTEKRNVDDYNYGREFAYIQFLNLIDGEIGWEYEGKHFDEADKEIKEWARNKAKESE